MKKSFYLMGTLVSVALMSISCQNLNPRLEALSNRVDKVKGEISLLENSISKGATIVSVDTVANGIKVNLSKGGPIVITNGKNGTDGVAGKDGTDGAAGKDGTSSVVTVQDGYWVIDGNKTDMPAENTSSVYYIPGTGKNAGKWVKVTQNAGSDTPVYTVTDKDIAVDAKLTAVFDPNSGKLTLLNLQGTDGAVVINGTTELRSMVFEPSLLVPYRTIAAVKGYGYSVFPVQSISDTTSTDPSQPETVTRNTKPTFFGGNIIFKYKLIPSNADINNVKFALDYRTMGDNGKQGVLDTLKLVSHKGAELELSLNAAKANVGDSKALVDLSSAPGALVRLTAVDKDNNTIASTQYHATTVVYDTLANLRLVCPKAEASKLGWADNSQYPYAYSSTLQQRAGFWYIPQPGETSEQIKNNNIQSSDIIMNSGDSLDLKPLVALANIASYKASINGRPIALPQQPALVDTSFINSQGIHYSFSIVKNYAYEVAGVTTNQADYISLNNGVVTANKARSYVGHTPIIRVLAKNKDGVVFDVAYIKIYISSDPSKDVRYSRCDAHLATIPHKDASDPQITVQSPDNTLHVGQMNIVPFSLSNCGFVYNGTTHFTSSDQTSKTITSVKAVSCDPISVFVNAPQHIQGWDKGSSILVVYPTKYAGSEANITITVTYTDKDGKSRTVTDTWHCNIAK